MAEKFGFSKYFRTRKGWQQEFKISFDSVYKDFCEVISFAEQEIANRNGCCCVFAIRRLISLTISCPVERIEAESEILRYFLGKSKRTWKLATDVDSPRLARERGKFLQTGFNKPIKSPERPCNGFSDERLAMMAAIDAGFIKMNPIISTSPLSYLHLEGISRVD